MARLTIEIENHVAHVTLTRGDKHNAMDQDMMNAIVEGGESLDRDDVRAVVLSGEGPSFCAGIDIMSFAKLAMADTEELIMPRTHGNANLFQQVSMAWRKLPVPVIAALHGATYGAGFQLAMGADIRIAAPDTRMAVMEMKWGLIPDMGGMALLPSLVRSDVLRQMIYTATPVGAERCERWGLLTEIADDPLAKAKALAEEIAGKSPSAIQAAKRLIGDTESEMSQDDVLLREAREQVDLIGKPHQMEAIAAGMAKRSAVFK